MKFAVFFLLVLTHNDRMRRILITGKMAACFGAKKGKIKAFLLFLAFFFFVSARYIFAAMSSTNYQIQWDELSAGGGQSTSSSYQLQDSVASAGDRQASSANYLLDQGFRAGIYDPVVDFVPYIQDRATQVAATDFIGSDQVTVTTSTGYAVGDWILMVQNEGQSQVMAMAQITDIDDQISPVIQSVLTITTPLSGSTPSDIDGSGDYVYRMSTSGSVDFGTLSSSSVSMRTVGWVANADVTQGYNVYLFDDGDLRTDDGEVIGDVTDGAVDVAGSEYGARSSDTTLALSAFDIADTAITTTPQQVASVTANPFESAGFVTLKLSVKSSQMGGSYAQTLSVIFVGDY